MRETSDACADEDAKEADSNNISKQAIRPKEGLLSLATSSAPRESTLAP
jgi:hypothetical protein